MDYARTIVNELGQALSSISERNTENLIDMIEGADRVFLAGCGRSGLMVRGFAMRLMHMGKKVYVVGETTTPSINQGDLLIIASGSGETGSLVAMANKCKKNRRFSCYRYNLPEGNHRKTCGLRCCDRRAYRQIATENSCDIHTAYGIIV